MKLILNHLALFLMAIFSSYASYLIFYAHPSLDFDFYLQIMNFTGAAPDQYRILPYLVFKALYQALGSDGRAIKISILLYNVIFVYGVLALIESFAKVPTQKLKFNLQTLFVVIYPLFMFTGWRPTTSFIVFVTMLFVCVMQRQNKTVLHHLSALLLIVILSFCRADSAAFLAGFYWLFEKKVPTWSKVILVIVPFVAQFILQKVCFTESQYYIKTFMLIDNFKLYYFAINPCTYLLAGIILLKWKTLCQGIQFFWAKHKLFLLMCLAYLGVIFLIGRPNELRLYLPYYPVLVYLVTLYSKPQTT